MIQQILQHLSSVDAYEQIAGRFAKVPGYLHAKEGFALFLLARMSPQDGEIVEIGSFMGRSTCFLALGAQMANRGRIVAIDHFTGSPEHQKGATHEIPEIAAEGSTFDRFRENLVSAGLWDRTEAIQLSSTEAAQDWSRPIRLLLIDGDHSYEATKEDFDAFSPFVVEGGIICFHDVGTWPGVTRFYQELVQGGGPWTEQFTINSLAVVVRAGGAT